MLATYPNLLKTKIGVPAAKNNLVERDRLIESMQSGLSGKITLICAPDGSGKTTLAVQWANRHKRLCAWVTLNAADNDTARFWRYIVHSFAAVLPAHNVQRLLSLADAFPNLSIDTFLDALINELYALSDPVVLLLDDYHSIHNERIHESVSYFIQYLPNSVHVTLCTRSEPPLPVAKWRVQGELNDIDARELQFTLSETGLFYRQMSGADFELTQIRELTQLTEGWAAGLQLVSLSLRTEPEFGRAIEQFRGEHRDVSVYLWDEVVSKLPRDLYHFLLRTSVLDRMDADLCNAVTGLSDSLSMLKEALRLNLFIVPLDDTHTWFRYHHLFAQFLREHLIHNDHEQWIDSNRLASRRLAQRGFADEAIEHAVAANDFPLMAQHLEGSIPALMNRGEFATLIRYFECFPPDFPVPPELSLLHAFVQALSAELHEANMLLERVNQACKTMEPSERRSQLASGMLFVKSNLLLSNGDFGKWFEFADGILDELLPENPTYYNIDFNRTAPCKKDGFRLEGCAFVRYGIDRNDVHRHPGSSRSARFAYSPVCEAIARRRLLRME